MSCHKCARCAGWLHRPGAPVSGRRAMSSYRSRGLVLCTASRRAFRALVGQGERSTSLLAATPLCPPAAGPRWRGAPSGWSTATATSASGQRCGGTGLGEVRSAVGCTPADVTPVGAGMSLPCGSSLQACPRSLLNWLASACPVCNPGLPCPALPSFFSPTAPLHLPVQLEGEPVPESGEEEEGEEEEAPIGDQRGAAAAQQEQQPGGSGGGGNEPWGGGSSVYSMLNQGPAQAKIKTWAEIQAEAARKKREQEMAAEAAAAGGGGGGGAPGGGGGGPLRPGGWGAPPLPREAAGGRGEGKREKKEKKEKKQKKVGGHEGRGAVGRRSLRALSSPTERPACSAAVQRGQAGSDWCGAAVGCGASRAPFVGSAASVRHSSGRLQGWRSLTRAPLPLLPTSAALLQEKKQKKEKKEKRKHREAAAGGGSSSSSSEEEGERRVDDRQQQQQQQPAPAVEAAHGLRDGGGRYEPPQPPARGGPAGESSRERGRERSPLRRSSGRSRSPPRRGVPSRSRSPAARQRHERSRSRSRERRQGRPLSADRQRRRSRSRLPRRR